MPISTNHDGQRLIDRQIAARTAAQYTLRRQRNALSAINQLPHDVLSHLFLTYKKDFHVFEGNEDYYEGSLLEGRWTNILRVCSHWRHIIVNTPRFWSSIALDSEDYLQMPTFIHRSKNVPLRIHLVIRNDPCEDWEAFLTAVVQLFLQCTRFEYLCLNFELSEQGTIEQLIQIMDEDSAPLLRSLKLVSGLRDSTPNCHLSTLPWKGMPSLRALMLHNVFISPDIPQLPSLEILNIGEGDVTIDWIIRFLRNTPNIKAVDLELVTSSTLPQSFSPKLSLPTLRKLVVHGEDISTACLFEIMDLPLTSMEVTFTVEKIPAAHHPGIAILRSLCAGLTSTRAGDTSLRMFVHNGEPKFRLITYNAGNAYTKLELCLSPIPILFHVSSSAPLSRVTELTIRYGGDLDPTIREHWLGLLNSMDNISLLSFFGCCLGFIRDLINTIAVKASLDTLSYEDVRWAKSGRNGPETHPSTPETLAALETFCDKQCQAGHAINKFVIRNCGIMPKDIEILRGFAEVEWDGVETVKYM